MEAASMSPMEATSMSPMEATSMSPMEAASMSPMEAASMSTIRGIIPIVTSAPQHPNNHHHIISLRVGCVDSSIGALWDMICANRSAKSLHISPMASLVLTDSSQLTSDSQNLEKGEWGVGGVEAGTINLGPTLAIGKGRKIRSLFYSSPTASLVLTDSSQLTYDSQHVESTVQNVVVERGRVLES
uniref:Uncharacterized protein n=1 Tax=Timema monikensis TaxID=170555 RepID=A0A7R9EGV3_9NEOP|nr:unnamed protein product [Timema monikensis]